MPRKVRRQLTEKEIHKIEGWSAIRVPTAHMADLLNMARTDFQEQINKRDVVRRAIDEGRANGSTRVRGILYQKAVGQKAHKDDNDQLIPEVPPDMRALEFWCRTQEGFKVADRLEISGPNEGPIQSITVQIVDAKARKD